MVSAASRPPSHKTRGRGTHSFETGRKTWKPGPPARPNSRNSRSLVTSRLFIMRVGFIFFMKMVLSAAFVALGLLILFWPNTYLRWVRWSKGKDNAPWWFRGWDVNHLPLPWGIRIFGVVSVLFGITFAVLSIWIHWFQ